MAASAETQQNFECNIPLLMFQIIEDKSSRQFLSKNYFILIAR